MPSLRRIRARTNKQATSAVVNPRGQLDNGIVMPYILQYAAVLHFGVLDAGYIEMFIVELTRKIQKYERNKNM